MTRPEPSFGSKPSCDAVIQSAKVLNMCGNNTERPDSELVRLVYKYLIIYIYIDT